MAVQAQFMLMPATTNVYNDQQGEILQQQHQMLQRAMLSGPDSRRTYNASESRKSFLDDEMMMLQPSFHQKTTTDRSSGSAGTSTSGGPISQGMEIDALIRLHNAKLRAGLDEIANKHCKQLISMMETQAIKKLSQKEMEVAAAKRRQAELEVKLRQLTSENQIWFNFAKNSEAAIAGLKANLDQVLQQNGDRHMAVEGVGDAESCCNGREEEERMRRLCKVCGEKDVSVLVLPCRHLCLCQDCEAVAGTCPVCDVPKNAGMQVVLG